MACDEGNEVLSIWGIIGSISKNTNGRERKGNRELNNWARKKAITIVIPEKKRNCSSFVSFLIRAQRK
jgi:hypothetical protein